MMRINNFPEYYKTEVTHGALSCRSGQVVVMEINIEKRQKPERVRLTSDHVGCTVTCLQWGGHNSKLFVGDNVGKITVCYIPSSKVSGFIIQDNIIPSTTLDDIW